MSESVVYQLSASFVVLTEIESEEIEQLQLRFVDDM